MRQTTRPQSGNTQTRCLHPISHTLYLRAEQAAAKLLRVVLMHLNGLVWPKVWWLVKMIGKHALVAVLRPTRHVVKPNNNVVPRHSLEEDEVALVNTPHGACRAVVRVLQILPVGHAGDQQVRVRVNITCTCSQGGVNE